MSLGLDHWLRRQRRKPCAWNHFTKSKQTIVSRICLAVYHSKTTNSILLIPLVDESFEGHRVRSILSKVNALWNWLQYPRLIIWWEGQKRNSVTRSILNWCHLRVLLTLEILPTFEHYFVNFHPTNVLVLKLLSQSDWSLISELIFILQSHAFLPFSNYCIPLKMNIWSINFIVWIFYN